MSYEIEKVESHLHFLFTDKNENKEEIIIKVDMESISRIKRDQ